MGVEIIDRDFAKELLKTFDNPQAHGVHLLFNQWWQYASDQVIAEYVADFSKIPAQKEFLEAGYFAEQRTLEELSACREGSLGRAYHSFITCNGLEANLATNYKAFHEQLSASGQLDRMPAELRYAIIRGFQIHDILHVLTGYKPDPSGEIALQAFCLAQIRFPYFGMWMSVVTSRMTFLDPKSILPMMDAISAGWQYGRTAANLQFIRWEDMLDRPLQQLRGEYGLSRADGGLSMPQVA